MQVLHILPVEFKSHLIVDVQVRGLVVMNLGFENLFSHHSVLLIRRSKSDRLYCLCHLGYKSKFK